MQYKIKQTLFFYINLRLDLHLLTIRFKFKTQQKNMLEYMEILFGK